MRRTNNATSLGTVPTCFCTLPLPQHEIASTSAAISQSMFGGAHDSSTSANVPLIELCATMEHLILGQTGVHAPMIEECCFARETVANKF